MTFFCRIYGHKQDIKAWPSPETGGTVWLLGPCQRRGCGERGDPPTPYHPKQPEAKVCRHGWSMEEPCGDCNRVPA